MNSKIRSSIVYALLFLYTASAFAKFGEPGFCENVADGKSVEEAKALEEKAKVMAELRRVEPMLTKRGKGVDIDWSGIRDEVRRRAFALGETEKDLQGLTAVVYDRGVEIDQPPLPWSATSLKLNSRAHGQTDYYVEYRRGKKAVHRSSFGLLESKDGQQLAEDSFDNRFAGEVFGVKYSDGLSQEMASPEITSAAVRLSYDKIVWVAKPEATAASKLFIAQAEEGVDVRAHFGSTGEPTRVEIVDRKTKARIPAPVTDFYFKVDAAFSGHSFFWDDMLVALSTVAHHPWLVRSTLEFWLDVQERNGGVIPREVRKSNLRSLFFPDKILYGEEKPAANLVFTNPYLMNWVMDELYRYNPSKENLALLKRVYKSVDDYTQWMEANRAVFKNGEIVGFNGSALGTGADNSRGRIGNRNEPEAYQAGLVDFMAQQIQMYKDLARWSRVIAAAEGNSPSLEGKGAAASAKARALTVTMNKLYWNEERCFYYDIIPDGPGQWKQNLDFTVVGGFWSLWAGVASREQLNCMIEKQMVPEAFGGDFPFPANARNSIGKYKDPLYVPRPGDEEDGYWDKWAHWPPMVMMAIEGFRRMGRADLAYEYALSFLKKTAEWSVETVEESLGETTIRMPDGRIIGFKARAIQHAEHMHRPDFAGWGKGPPVYLLLNHILGINPTYSSKLQWNLMVPLERGEFIEVKNLQYMGQTVRTLKVRRNSSGAHEVTVDADGPIKIELNIMRDEAGRLRNKPVYTQPAIF